MYWLYFGHCAVLYAAVGGYALWTLPDHPRPAAGLFAALVLIPLVIFAIGAFTSEHIPRQWQDGIDQKRAGGQTSRADLFKAGCLTGMAGLALSAVAYFVLEPLASLAAPVVPRAAHPYFLVGGVLAMLAPLAITPLFAIWRLAKL